MKKMTMLLCCFSLQILFSQVGINTSNPQKMLDVNGNFSSKYQDASTGLFYELTNYKNDLAGSPTTTMSIANNSSLSAATEYSLLGIGKGAGNFVVKDANGISVLQFNAGITAFISQTTTASTSFWGQSTGSNPYSRMEVGNASGASAKVETNTTNGIQFTANSISGTTQSTYSFPAETGTNGQIMALNGNTTSLTGKLQWKNISDIMILKSPNGSCYKITVNDSGVLSTSSIACN
ncbi:hypothetical protein IW15_12745 [Chryseobacterium soli]|uniref:Uncharacterized protein n=1 Tax=Chryseobacterium soli TaxID=445961 RepID=A0A086A6U9_9FLAO|nr:hypothetical protein [Chryseobacterium soli]KFF12413.1 hypothetical protein IW15_12745 [Chryseobacterium soli]